MADERPDELVGLIYDTVAAPERWQAVLDQIAGRLGAQATALVVLDRREARAQVAAATGVFDAAAMASYRTEFARLDPAPAAFAQQQVGVAASTDRMFSAEFLEHDVFLNEFLRPLGLEECLGASLLKDEERTAQIGILRGRDRRAFGERELAAMDRLLPHIQRALQLHRKFAALDGVSNTLAAMVDDLPSGLIVLDAGGQVIHLNRGADAITARRDGIAIDRDGCIALASSDAAKQLAGLLHDVLQGGASGGVLRVPRKHGRGAYTMLVSPQPGRLGLLEGQEGGRGAMVVIHDPDRVPQVPARLLGAVYGLTRREEELATALVGGVGVAEFAAQAGISLNTVRFHLKAIYAKTGTRGQSDLVRAVMTTIATLGAERHLPLWRAARGGKTER